MADITDTQNEVKTEQDQDNDMIASQILQAKNLDKKVMKKPKSSIRSRDKNNNIKNNTKDVKKNSKPKKAKQEVFCEEMNNPLNIYKKKKYQDSFKNDKKKYQNDEENQGKKEYDSPGIMENKKSLTTSQRNEKEQELYNDF